jgi:hypothetical protein
MIPCPGFSLFAYLKYWDKACETLSGIFWVENKKSEGLDSRKSCVTLFQGQVYKRENSLENF